MPHDGQHGGEAEGEGDGAVGRLKEKLGKKSKDGRKRDVKDFLA